MFNKKNDPLVESVKAVMKQNEVHRQAEAALNEELGISSKKALPHEYHAQYDALLEAKTKVFHADEVEAGKFASKLRDTVDKLTGKSKKTPDDDHYKQQLKRRKDHPTLEEKTDMSKADIAALRHPKKKFTGADLAGLRAGEHKMEEESGLKSTMNGTDIPAKGAKPAGKLEEKAVSKAQHRFFGLVRGIQKGQAHGSAKAEKAAEEMSTKEVRKFAKTKEKGLPERVDEAEGDVDPSKMTPISTGLQDRIVKDPPNPKPEPEPKKMDEVRILGPKGAGKQLAQMSGTTKDPKDETKTPLEFRRNLIRAVSQRSKQERDWRKADKSLAESVFAEIRENLEANLIAIHESGDDELFENYINSLTEEELEILGLAEDWRSAAFGDNTSGGSLSNAGYRTPPSVAAAQARGAARPQQQARPSPSPAARPAPTAAKPKPATPYIDSDAERATPGGGLAPKQAKTQNAVPDKPNQSPIPGTMDGFGPPEPAVMPKPEPGTTGTGSTGRPTSDIVKTVPNEQPRVKKPQPTGGPGPMPDLPPMAEQVKSQIKESLESFVRNRFLKG